jgi:hypothetical protein
MRTVAVVLLAGCLGLPGAVVSSGFQFEHGRRPLRSTSVETPGQSPTTVVGNSPNAEIQDQMAREQRARYLAETHSQAIADAKRLAQLARELEDELDRSDGLTLSASAMKKTDEIAKLAKSVKSKMRTY